jgi:site-specific DNA recombinase
MASRPKPAAVEPVAVGPIRCAIYTRKSTDENLDTDFNSLDAQREAAEAYIRSQQREGWIALPDRYDDGAFSGATMERPALQRLMVDVRAGRVNTIVVYKIDRLSRSLLDFAKLVEELERHGVSLVAVTQQFNTTTSMGRLTLNVLLSFAQYEREVIAERIRDKMSASRKKGKYLGGVPPLGYDVDRVHKRLIVSAQEALLVRHVFRRYLELGCAVKLIRELNEAGHLTKGWTTKKGKTQPGKPWHKNYVYRLLRNPVYIGKVEYQGETYEGEHDPIVEKSLWDQVQKAIAVPGKVRSNMNRATTPGLLKGILRCGHCGAAMAVTFTQRHGRQYRYYVCHRASSTAYENCTVRSVSAGIIEELVKNRLRALFRSPEVVSQTIEAIRRLQAEERHQIEVERSKVVEDLTGVKSFGDQLVQSLQGADTTFVRSELERLDGRRADLEAKLGELDEQLAALTGQEAVPESVNKELTILDNIWANLFPGEQQRLVRMVIDRATIYTDRLDLTLSGEGVQAVVDLLVAEHSGQDVVPASGSGGQAHTISLPIQFKKRAGRREIILPADGKQASAPPNRIFLLTLARAFRWKDLLESGKFKTVKALAAAVGLERSYIAKLLNLALLSPKIVEALVAGDEPDGLAVGSLRQGVTVRWDKR